MKVHNITSVKFKIRDICYNQIGYDNLKSVSELYNLKSVSELYNNLVFYNSQRVYENISESVEKQMERK